MGFEYILYPKSGVFRSITGHGRDRSSLEPHVEVVAGGPRSVLVARVLNPSFSGPLNTLSLSGPLIPFLSTTGCTYRVPYSWFADDGCGKVAA